MPENKQSTINKGKAIGQFGLKLPTQPKAGPQPATKPQTPTPKVEKKR